MKTLEQRLKELQDSYNKHPIDMKFRGDCSRVIEDLNKKSLFILDEKALLNIDRGAVVKPQQLLSLVGISARCIKELLDGTSKVDIFFKTRETICKPQCLRQGNSLTLQCKHLQVKFTINIEGDFEITIKSK